MTDIETFDIPEQNKEESVLPERTEPKPLPQETKELKPKEQIIKKTNENLNLQQYGLKLVDEKKLQRNYALLIIALVTITLLFFVNMIWQNTNLGKLADKDFQISVNPETNITNQYNNTFNPQTDNQYTFTINNTIVFPQEMLIRLANESS